MIDELVSISNGILVLLVWELVLVCVDVVVKHAVYQHKVDVHMLNAVKSVLADVLSVSPLSEQTGD